jgi:hypothetical protein
MFSFLTDSKPAYTVIDKVWISTEAKWRACLALVSANPNCVLVTWFPNTYEFLVEKTGNKNQVIHAEKSVEKGIDTMFVFAERYPLAKPEQVLFERLKQKEIPILSALDEPLFMHFGGERTIELMKKLGLKEDEPVGHSMISSSIQNAQKKLEKLVLVERKASSAEEWFQINTKR